MLIHAIQALKHLPIEQKQAWQQMLNHYLFDNESDSNSHIPREAQGLLGDFKPDVAERVQNWLVDQLK